MRESGIYGPHRAGRDRWMTLYWHAASLPTIPPKGMINYCSDKAIIHAVNILCQHIAKKVRGGETTYNNAIKGARAAHAWQYPGDPNPPHLNDHPPPLRSPTLATKQLLLPRSSSQPRT